MSRKTRKRRRLKMMRKQQDRKNRLRWQDTQHRMLWEAQVRGKFIHALAINASPDDCVKMARMLREAIDNSTSISLWQRLQRLQLARSWESANDRMELIRKYQVRYGGNTADNIETMKLYQEFFQPWLNKTHETNHLS